MQNTTVKQGVFYRYALELTQSTPAERAGLKRQQKKQAQSAAAPAPQTHPPVPAPKLPQHRPVRERAVFVDGVRLQRADCDTKKKE